MTDEYIDIEGKKVHFVKSSTSLRNNTIVFLHGKSFKAETWSSIDAPKRINEIGLNYVAVDYPGWGESERNENYYPPTVNYSNSALFIETFASKIGLEKFSLLGASFSGPFVISYASKHPESINKLILVGPVWSEELSSEALRIRKPVLICYGENDSVIPRESFIKYSNSIKGSSLVTVKKAGHALYMDNPEAFFTILKEFMVE